MCVTQMQRKTFPLPVMQCFYCCMPWHARCQRLLAAHSGVPRAAPHTCSDPPVPVDTLDFVASAPGWGERFSIVEHDIYTCTQLTHPPFYFRGLCTCREGHTTRRCQFVSASLFSAALGGNQQRCTTASGQQQAYVASLEPSKYPSLRLVFVHADRARMIA